MAVKPWNTLADPRRSMHRHFFSDSVDFTCPFWEVFRGDYTDAMNAQDSAETRRLLDQVSAGNRDAFDRLFARHRDDVLQSVLLRVDGKLRARFDPSDVVQETQIEAFSRMEDYLARRPMPFRLWLRKTAYERLAKLRERHIKAAKRSVDREMPLSDQTSVRLVRQLCAPGSTPSEKVVRQELAQRVKRTLSHLSEADREILLMRYVEKLSNQEIGYILEIESGTVSKRHGRALLRLEKLLKENGIRESDL